MVLIEIFIPQYGPRGEPFPRERFETLQHELTLRFGGVTAHVRSPATGLWKRNGGQIAKDDIVIFEVMTEDVDRTWWHQLQKRLEEDFEQEEVLIRVTAVERL